MPALNETNVRHLLRRTEFVDRTARVRELLALGSFEAAVDNVMAIAATPARVRFTIDHEWRRQEEMAHFWIQQMATSRRPFQERMALWWHTHFATSFDKVEWAEGMRQQIDLFRRDALGNFRNLAVTMSLQVPMLRYLDNNQNRASSPNQNFARELIELFVLGVGNYTEADVEAATAAWTGHTDDIDDTVAPYRWRADWHDGSVKSFLGRRINDGGDPRRHGPETIEVMLGAGVVPAGAPNAANRGRPTRDVAAEFLSFKLGQHFGSSTPPAGVVRDLAATLVRADFDVRPWVRALLLRDEFYTAETRTGLVRNPIELMVAFVVATGARVRDAVSYWLMDGMGQRPFYPPNVAGWKTNGYWVNASAMEFRERAAMQVFWYLTERYWEDDPGAALVFANGSIPRAEVVARTATGGKVMSDAVFLDRMLAAADLRIGAATRTALLDVARGLDVWSRVRLVQMLFLAPEMHLA